VDGGSVAPVAASLLAALVTTAGISVIRHFEGWARAHVTCFACFAAGVLISVSLLHASGLRQRQHDFLPARGAARGQA
jgi:hypothetical protein